MIIPFIKKPKLTIEQQVAKNVATGGLSGAMKFYERLARDEALSKSFGGLIGGIGKRGLEILGKPPYSPTPTLETHTPEEAREFERKRISKKRRRKRTRITGELEPETRGKALLG